MDSPDQGHRQTCEVIGPDTNTNLVVSHTPPATPRDEADQPIEVKNQATGQGRDYENPGNKKYRRRYKACYRSDSMESDFSTLSEEKEADNQPWESPVRYRAEYVCDSDDEGREGPLVDEVTGRIDKHRHGVLEVIYCYRCRAKRPWTDRRITTLRKGAIKTNRSRIRIHSSKLINALRAVVEYYPSQDLLGETVEFRDPFRFIFHHQEKLEWYKDHHPPQHNQDYRRECNEHIDILLAEFDKLEGKRVRTEKERHRRGVATFENLWMLFRPGERVFVKAIEPRQIWSALLTDITGGVLGGRERKYRLSLWYVRNEGIRFSRSKYNTCIPPFEGERDIMSLPVYPQRCHRDTKEELARYHGNTLMEQMAVWGEEYWRLSTPTLKEFYGECISPQTLPRIEGRVVVDFQSYHSFAHRFGTRYWQPHTETRWTRELSDTSNSDSDIDIPVRARQRKSLSERQRTREGMISRGCECEDCIKLEPENKKATYRHYDDVNPKGDPPEDRKHFFSLCSRDVCAFSLKERSFVMVDIDGLQDPKFDKHLFDYLVLPKEIKNTLRTLALGNTHQRKNHDGKTFTADFIRGKGEGQVFLLHGKPGVGKTCAAECIAEIAQRPLLSVTSGDLGTTAEDFDRHLSMFFRLGESWDAIVLIDEADIYFEERSRNDIERNGLVSVLLRALEYYRGTLFLTTNRIGVIDEAFMSRIHISFGFPDLTHENREQIWLNNFDRLTRVTNIEVADTVRSYIRTSGVASLKWNGRHIRNAFQTAVALAEADSLKTEETPRITQEHLESVVRLSKEFKAYMFKVHKDLSDEEWAWRKSLRAKDDGTHKNEKTWKIDSVGS